MHPKTFLLLPLIAALNSPVSGADSTKPVDPVVSPEQKANKQVTWHILVLEKRPPPPVSKLKVPNGFS